MVADTILINKLSGNEIADKFINPINGKIDTESMIEDSIKLAFNYISGGSIWTLKIKYPGSKGSANDGLIPIRINGEWYYGINESKLHHTNKDRMQGKCQGLIYTDMFSTPIREKIVFILISTDIGGEIIFTENLIPVLNEIHEIRNRKHITPSKALDDWEIYKAINTEYGTAEEYDDTTIAFYWRELEDFRDIIQQIIDKIKNKSILLKYGN